MVMLLGWLFRTFSNFLIYLATEEVGIIVNVTVHEIEHRVSKKKKIVYSGWFKYDRTEISSSLFITLI